MPVSAARHVLPGRPDVNARAGSNSALRGQLSAQFGTTTLAIGMLALLYVAPLSAQSAKSLIDFLTNPQVQDMPPLVRASSDGVMLAGRLVVDAVPRVTLTAHRGDKIAPADPQRLAAASPDIISLSHREGTRLPSHFLTTENEADRAILNVIFAGKIPDHFKNIEPAANAPKVDFVKPDPLVASAVAPAHPPAPVSETAVAWTALSALATVAADRMELPDGFKIVPPPLVRLVAVEPQTVPAAAPDLTALAAVPAAPGLAAVPAAPGLAAVPAAPGLAAVVPPTIKGQPVTPPDTGTAAAALPGTATPTVPVVAPLTGNALDLAVQGELKRLNCYSGSVDGSFGPGSQGALDLFFQTTKLTRASPDMTQAVLDQLKAVADSACSKPYVGKVSTPVVVHTPPPATGPKAPQGGKPPKGPAVTAPPKGSADPCVAHPEQCIPSGI